ncbi:hypothetical protein [Microbacterium hydrothermale]|uniref:hypothetical protein n=1 Tax=Microbacterium hydrothermale TaxID=857427 RepID=UPI0010A89420|nr:hypothetical protein [Microbacterium hydrothermale]
MTAGHGRIHMRALLGHPLLWAVLCGLAALRLLGTNVDFAGFLLCLIAGWLVAHAVVRGLMALRSPGLSFGLHVGVAAAAAAALFLLTRGVIPGAVDASVTAALSFSAVPAAGWIWLTLIGRVSGLVRADSARRTARLVSPDWTRTNDVWELRLPAVALRLSTYRGVVGILFAVAAGVLSVFVVVFSDVAMRMSPLMIVVVLGWLIGLPIYGAILLIARARTVEVLVRVTRGRLVIERTTEEKTDATRVVDLAFGEVRALRWAARDAPTRVEVRPVAGSGVVLLFGLARRPAGMAATLPALPTGLRRRLEEAGLSARASRGGDPRGLSGRDADLLLTRDASASARSLTPVGERDRQAPSAR